MHSTKRFFDPMLPGALIRRHGADLGPAAFVLQHLRAPNFAGRMAVTCRLFQSPVPVPPCWNRHPSAGISVYCCLLAHASPDGTNCRPAKATIAQECGMGERAVDRAIAKLIDLGLVHLEEKGGGHRSNRYRLLLLAEAAPRPRQVSSNPVVEAPQGRTTGTPAAHQMRLCGAPDAQDHITTPAPQTSSSAAADQEQVKENRAPILRAEDDLQLAAAVAAEVAAAMKRPRPPNNPAGLRRAFLSDPVKHGFRLNRDGSWNWPSKPKPSKSWDETLKRTAYLCSEAYLADLEKKQAAAQAERKAVAV